ncbi:MAG TPA: hypothetical protein VLA71_00995 [Algoriphagus sp.]|nr:hypothetical protein [Algoriphagus sp.]
MSNSLENKKARISTKSDRTASGTRSPIHPKLWEDNRREASVATTLQRMANPKQAFIPPPEVRPHMGGQSEGVMVKSQGLNEASHPGKNSGEVVQRAITVGMNTVPRTVDLNDTMKNQLISEGLFDEFARLNDERGKIYIFQNDQHLIAFLKQQTGKSTDMGVPHPLIHQVDDKQLDEGHKRAQDLRFHSIYQPSPQQISQNASGSHQIAPHMMPPSGQGHHWGQMPIPGSNQEYVLYQNQLQPPPNPTQPLTFGNPLAPSLVMNQGGNTLGMHIQPTSSPFISPITRDQSTYGGIPSETGRVRGHPFALEQNQISTDDPSKTFDNDPRTYTSESDSTKTNGGISSWRYNEVEKKSFQNGTSFTQVNNNSVIGGMGIGQPSSMHYRMESSSGGYTDLHMDNSGTVDYRGTNGVRPKGMGKQAYQTEMGKASALSNPYPQVPIHQPGQDFLDPDRHSYPGYMSPPPTPFLSFETLAEPEVIEIYPIAVHVGSRVTLSDGREGQVTEILDRDLIRQKARCKVLVLNGNPTWNSGSF